MSPSPIRGVPEHLLARYLPERLLGQGSFGTVLLAWDRQSGGMVALKLFKVSGLGGGAFEVARRRFEREARAMAVIDHPNVVKVHALDADSTPPYLVMEYVEGGDLATTLARGGPWDAERIRALGRQIGSAIDTLHQGGILHRDLKPANIMIRRADGSAVVMDLGLAYLSGDTMLTKTGQVVGTPRYLPPEVALGKPWSERGDVYQIALILWEAMTGQPMFQGLSLGELIQRVQQHDHQPIPEGLSVPASLVSALARGAHPDPSQRFATGADLARALRDPTASIGMRAGLVEPTGERLTQAMRGLLRARSSIVPALSVACLAAGALGYALGPFPAGPEDLRQEVIGDALVVTWRQGTAPGMRLEAPASLAQVAMPMPTGSSPPRARLVLRGLPEDRPVAVRLAWEGGAGATQNLVAGPLAVGPAARLTAGRRLHLSVSRPCVVRFRGAPRWFHLEPGEPGVEPPPVSREPLVLEIAEEGLTFSRRFEWSELGRGLVERCRGWVGELDPVVMASEAIRLGRPAPGFEVPRRRLRPLVDWLPELAGSGLDRDQLRQAFQLWETWDRSSTLERQAGLSPRHAEGPQPGLPGSRQEGLPEGAPNGAVELPLEPVGSQREVHGRFGIELTTPEAKRNPAGKYGEAAALLAFAWPAEAPLRGHRIAISVEETRLKAGFQLRLRERVETTSSGFGLHIWPLSTLRTESARHRQGSWWTHTLPAEICPGPGTPMALELVPMGIEPWGLARIRRVRVAWFASP